MSNKIILKKSSVSARVPTTSDLDYGELALNYADGILYYKNAANTISVLNAGGSAYTAGDGLTLTGSQFSVDNTVVRTTGSYADPSWITSLDYSKLSGTVPTWNQNTTGSAASLTTARTLTIGNSGKTFNGTANVSWSLSEIGAYPATNPDGYTSNTGTVTSINLTAGTGMSVSGGPITTSGSITVTNNDRGSSQNIFKNIANSAGTTQFSAGSNNDTIRIASSGAASVSFDNVTKTITIGATDTNTTYSAGTDLSLAGTTFNHANSGVTAGTYNNVTVNARGHVTSGSNLAYLTGNQTITLSGDVTGSGTTSIETTLANSGVTAGSYTAATITVDAKGRVTAASSNTIGNGTLTLATSGIATGSQTFSANQGTNATFTVNVPGTNLGYTTAASTGTVTSSTGNNATIPAATTSLAGLMTGADKTKLDGIAAGANNYTLPNATTLVTGGIKLGSDTVQSVAASSVTATAARSYAIQVNSSGQAVVNVPWVNTTYSEITEPEIIDPASTAAMLVSGRRIAYAFNNIKAATAGNADTVTNGVYTTGSYADPSWITSINYSKLTGTVPTWNQNTTGTSAGVVRTVTGTTSAELVRGNMGDNDQARILVGATATNAGFLEIATADDGTEPIHVRQYSGVFATLLRTATLLDGSGNTTFPGTVTANGVTLTGNTGTVTSVSGTGTVSGLTLSGSVTTSGNLTLSGTLSVTPSNFASQTANTFLAAPNGSTGTPTFRGIVAADVPTLNQNTTGSAASLSGTTTAAIQTSALASGTANSTTFLRGDRTWATISTGAWTRRTTTYTAVSGDKIIADTTGGAFTITLPASPALGNSVLVADGGNWKTNNLTIARNGQTIEGLAENLVIDIQNIQVELVFDGTTWQVYAAAGPGGSVVETKTDNVDYKLLFTGANNGDQSTAFINADKLYFNPSTGQLNATNFNSLSDARKKTNIQSINNAVATVEKLRGVTFEWITDKTQSLGVIAQEVEEVLPCLVSTSYTGEKSVSYGNIVGLLIEAIKEQQQQIEELKKRIGE